MSELVHLEVAERVATITLDSPHNRNALSRELITSLVAHLTAAAADGAVRVVRLRSAHRVFCSGADLAEASESSTVEGPRLMVRLQRAIAAVPKPVVVEVGGAVRAGGLGIVGAADIVLAGESATFAVTEVRLALAPWVLSLSVLGRIDSRSAADLFLSGRTFSAAEAARIGLITRAVPDAELATAVHDAIVELAECSPQGLAETKRLLNEALLHHIDTEGETAAARSAALFESPQAREAMRAFLTRRGR